MSVIEIELYIHNPKECGLCNGKGEIFLKDFPEYEYSKKEHIQKHIEELWIKQKPYWIYCPRCDYHKDLELENNHKILKGNNHE